MLALDARRRDDMATAAQRAFRERWSEAAALRAYFDLIRSNAARRGLDALAAALPGVAQTAV